MTAVYSILNTMSTANTETKNKTRVAVLLTLQTGAGLIITDDRPALFAACQPKQSRGSITLLIDSLQLHVVARNSCQGAVCLVLLRTMMRLYEVRR